MKATIKNFLTGVKQIYSKTNDAIDRTLDNYCDKAIDFFENDVIPEMKNIMMEKDPLDFYLYNYTSLKCNQFLKEMTPKVIELDESLNRKPLKDHLRDAIKLRYNNDITSKEHSSVVHTISTQRNMNRDSFERGRL